MQMPDGFERRFARREARTSPEQSSVAACRRLRVRLSKHAMDDCKHIRAGLDQRKAIFRGDATDSNYGHVDLTTYLCHHGRPGLYRSRLARRCEESAESHVVGPFVLRHQGPLGAVIAGYPDDRVLAEHLSGRARRQIVLAQMYAIRAHVPGQQGVVIDDEGDLVPAADADQRQRLLPALTGILALVPVLDHDGSAADDLLDGHGKVLDWDQRGIGNRIKPFFQKPTHGLSDRAQNNRLGRY